MCIGLGPGPEDRRAPPSSSGPTAPLWAPLGGQGAHWRAPGCGKAPAQTEGPGGRWCWCQNLPAPQPERQGRDSTSDALDWGRSKNNKKLNDPHFQSIFSIYSAYIATKGTSCTHPHTHIIVIRFIRLVDRSLGRDLKRHIREHDCVTCDQYPNTRQESGQTT